MKNEFTNQFGQSIVINGGDPLPGCPESWEKAHEWEIEANKDKKDYEPAWKFDCGFKLDFDGDIIHVSSRFYPPKNHYGEGWDGRVEILFIDKIISKKEFKTETLDQLKGEVEEYVANFKNKLMSKIKGDQNK